ncbi:hypothetical protein QJS04_geneDACA000219 [Acorus gramineus]|uniref:AMP-activated protein kinase glycogen-binding domain-containing protein n=1 Tax=Acorus gramineus TaxID=55184 RepID=A0AAV9ATQ4_ACOGR|nr:hypothetical protein QJS04_geneDACA000219 [Acorus gramineus]
MAILLHFPTRPPQRLFSVPHLKCEIHHIQPFKTPIHAFSANNKPRSRRKPPVKSNADLCDELREFILSVGLPGDRAPSLKELQLHGRKDLANIVRRRGYKLISELLSISENKDISEKENSFGDQDSTNNLITETRESQYGNDHDVAESNFLRSDLIVAESFPNQGNGALSNHNVFQVWESTESSSTSLHLKASTFVQNGELDSAEVAPDVEGSDVFDVSEPIYGTSSPSDADECDRSIGSVKPIQSSEQVFSQTDYRHPRDDILSLEEQSNDFCDDLTSETIEKDKQNEINRLRKMLHEKELELSQLKRQIEKEKIALDMLQVWADTEIGNVDRLISAKDVELKEVDENLSGMKEVKIEYFGSGEVVEVAGSFNGWHHQIKMDPHLSSKIVNPTGSRISQLWSTVLWLYPGVYEIKFIVDGHWKCDPQREILSKGYVTNNILRVDA